MDVGGLCCQPIPAAMKVHGHLTLFRRLRHLSQLLDLKFFRNLSEELCLRQTVQIFHDPIVIHDHQFLFREQNRQKIIKLFRSIIIRMFRSALQSYLHRRSCPVMSVCNIDAVHLLECRMNLFHQFRLCDLPSCMMDAVLRSKGKFWLSALYVLYQRTDLILCAICQKNRTGLCTAHIYMSDPVSLFFRSGILMLLDHMILILINRCTCHQSGLRTSIHGQFIEIVDRLLFFYIDPCLLLLFQSLSGCFIDFRSIHILIRSKHGLRPVNI